MRSIMQIRRSGDFHEYSNGLQELNKESLVKSFRIQKVTIKKPHCMELVYIISQLLGIRFLQDLKISIIGH
jgi:hypothetical protein